MIWFAYSGDALDVRTCQNWFARFKAGDFDLNDKEHTGRPIEEDDDFLQEWELLEPSKQSANFYFEQLTLCS